MCQIISKPGRVEIPFEDLKSSCITNPDGWGIMAVDRGRVTFQRNYDGPNVADNIARVLEEYEDFDIVNLHLRYSTVGPINTEMCHPYPIWRRGSRQLMMMHNGTLSDFGSKEKTDSLEFGEQVIAPLYELYYDNGKEPLKEDLFLDIIEEYLGMSSKVLLMDNKNQLICNSDQGTWLKDDDETPYWVSNTYSFNRSHRTPTTTTYNSWGRQTNNTFPSQQQPTNLNNKTTSLINLPKKEKKEVVIPKPTKRLTYWKDVAGMDNIADLQNMDWNTISDLVDCEPDNAKLLIKDLLQEIS